MTRSDACPTCGAGVIRTSSELGERLVLDRAATDRLGEALALLTGRRTYTLSTTRDRNSYSRTAQERTPGLIRVSVLEPRVHAEHRCGAAPLPTVPDQSPTWPAPTF